MDDLIKILQTIADDHAGTSVLVVVVAVLGKVCLVLDARYQALVKKFTDKGVP